MSPLRPPDDELEHLLLRHELWTKALGTKGGQLVLDDADLAGLDLAGRDLSDAYLGGCRLVGARLDGTLLHGSLLIEADLTDASLVEAGIAKARRIGPSWCGRGSPVPR
jgi:uncharacterized protein YjbI with pentapeptide repeats